jgi:hypothetical protein
LSSSYSPSLATPKDQVRFKIGDTTVVPAEAALFSDEEIQAMLMANGDSAIKAARACVRSLIARYSRMATMAVGDSSIQLGELAQHFRDLLKDLTRESATNGSAVPFAGGLTYSSKETSGRDTDRVQPSFARDGVGSTGRRFERDETGYRS